MGHLCALRTVGLALLHVSSDTFCLCFACTLLLPPGFHRPWLGPQRGLALVAALGYGSRRRGCGG